MLLVIASLALAACGGGAPAEAPAEEPAATDAPAEEPVAEPVEVTFWHAYGTGSAEETALATILEQAAVDMPNITINVLQVPFNDLFTKYDTDVAAGGGPDFFVAPNDNLGGQARAGTIADITDLVAGKLGDYSELSQGTSTQQFWNITVPLLRPSMIPAAVYGFTLSFNLFNFVFFMTGGGPARSTELLVTFAYNLVRNLRWYGVAAAFAVIIFVVALIVFLITNRITRATQNYQEG